jgi:hypothetical protein
MVEDSPVVSQHQDRVGFVPQMEVQETAQCVEIDASVGVEGRNQRHDGTLDVNAHLRFLLTKIKYKWPAELSADHDDTPISAFNLIRR